MGLATMPTNLDPRFATDAASTRLCRLLYGGLTEFDDRARPVPAMPTWKRLAPDHYRFGLIAGRASYPDGRQPADRLEAKHALKCIPWGSGPFRFEAWPSGGELRLRRRADQMLMTFLHAPDPNVRALKLQRGEIGLLQNDLPPELVGYLETRDGVTVIRRPKATFAYIALQFDDPQLGELAGCQAIGHAIDRHATVTYLFDGNARLGLSMLSPEPWVGTELAALEYVPTQSRRLSRRLGYRPERPLRLEYKTSSDPFRLRIAAALQAQLAEVGIALRVRSYDWETFFGNVKSGNFQLYILAWVGVDNPDIFRYVFHSASLPPGGANRGRYRSTAMDRLINQAETARDEAQRIAAF